MTLILPTEFQPVNEILKPWTTTSWNGARSVLSHWTTTTGRLSAVQSTVPTTPSPMRRWTDRPGITALRSRPRQIAPGVTFFTADSPVDTLKEMAQRNPAPKQPPAPQGLTEYLPELVAFWREVMKGSIVTTLDNGHVVEGSIPIECRLKASELLAKYLAPPPKGGVKSGSQIVAPPMDIMKLAEKLEKIPLEDLHSLLAETNGAHT